MAEALNRQKEIFLAALDLGSPDKRASYLVKACGADEPLRRQVEAMLHAYAAPDSFLERPAVAMGPTIDEIQRQPDEVRGLRVGPYKLLQKLGEGGMGMVSSPNSNPWTLMALDVRKMS